MKANTNDARRLKNTLVALVSILLLTGAGSVHSVAGRDEAQLACQGTTSCGG